ncbi:hypothetical protein C0W38_17605 [Photobacterium angustum]|nr:membrane protein [Photobacterium angustum]KJG22392.1 membrane protein [Photobacterium angustum]KJG28799.1 membrane protein [Photobacterium angustum]PSW96265.1 hypothetical protein C0W79_09520 [Photobacterium angustum]PSX02190.1 hypothetical protein C0W87_11165 [Photobacterium angustum]
MNKKRIFFIAFMVPIIYGIIWFLSLYVSTDLNHFFYEKHIVFLYLALPWSFFTIEVGAICSTYTNSYICNPLSILLISIGFAINVVVSTIILGGLGKIFKR